VLYLNPPFPVIRGVALMPDHADPLQWYFMPAAPRLSSIPDSVAGKPRPSLQMIKFRGDAGVGGFLNFDVNLGLDEGVLDDVKSELRSAQFKLPPGAIKLAPIPLVGGTVKLLVLGQESPPPTPPPGGTGGAGPTPTQPAESGPKFVTRISHDAHPSLYGDNQAAFSVMLDQYGVTVLEQALAGQMAPIGVVYSLDFLGLRPAYSVHLNIDWDRVQKHMDEHFGAETICTSTSIDKAVDELIDKRAIVLEADTFVPEDEANSSIIGNRDRALNEVRDMITEAFFKPSVDPIKPNDADKMVRTAQQVCKLIATGGLAPSFSYTRNDYKRVDKKVLDVNIRERTTVKRSIYPQGHLTGLFQVLRDQKLKLSDFVAEANLNDPWFQRRKVLVTSVADFDKDSIESINVKLSYGAQPQNVILNKQTTSQEVTWLSRLANGDMDRVVAYEYEIGFKAVDGAARPIRLKSPAGSVTVEKLQIQTGDLFSIVPVPITVANASLFPWARYPSIDVQCEYRDNAHNLSDQEHFLLEKDHPEKTWSLFVQRKAQDTEGSTPVDFRYRLTFHAADNRDFQTDWQSTTDRQVIVRDPFPQKRKLEVVPPANWTALDQAFVDLVYDDRKNQFRQEDSFRFTATENTPKTFMIDLRDPAERRVSFNATFVDKNGGVFEVPRSYTLENRLFLRGDMRGHRVIAVSAPKVNFTGKKIKELRTDLRYVDKDASLQYQSQVTLKSSTDPGTFEFDYVDNTKSNYEYRLSVLFLNGLMQDFDWKSADSADLNLDF
jgi:hypothetical protein